MKIRITTSFVRRDGEYLAKSEHELPDTLARRLIKQGVAVAVDGPAGQTTLLPIETAEQPPAPEQAVTRKPRARRSRKRSADELGSA